MSHHQHIATPTEDSKEHEKTEASHAEKGTPDGNASRAQAPNPQAGNTSRAEWTIIQPIGPLPHNHTLNSTLYGSAAQYAVRQAMARNDFQQALIREGLEKSDAERCRPSVGAFPYKEVPKRKAEQKDPVKSTSDRGRPGRESSAGLSESRQHHPPATSHHDDLDGSGGGWQRVMARHDKHSQREHARKVKSSL